MPSNCWPALLGEARGSRWHGRSPWIYIPVPLLPWRSFFHWRWHSRSPWIYIPVPLLPWRSFFHWRWHGRSPWIYIPVPPPLPCRSCHCSMSRLPCAIMSRLPLRLKSRLPCAINVAAAIAIDVTADSATSSSCGLAIAIDVASDSAALRPPPPVASPRGRHRGCLCDLLLLWPCHCDRCRG